MTGGKTTAGARRGLWPWLVVLLGLVVPYLMLEMWARTHLFEFKHVSYSNSRSLDASWRALNADRGWTMLFTGDSEVRWGFDPAAVDGELRKAGLPSQAFNFGIDGFSSGLSRIVVDHLDIPERLPRLRVMVVGVQLIEAHAETPIKSFGDISCDGALQKPIFTSSLAKDLDFAYLCQPPHWTRSVVAAIERVSAVIRYRQNLRSALVGWFEPRDTVLAFNSLALEHRRNGFQPHRPIAENRQNYEWELERRKELIAEDPHMRTPLDPALWPRLVAPGGYFDGWAQELLASGILPVFVALPTNPVLIDLQRRRADYARNSALLEDWAARRGDVVFVDLGIKDDFSPDRDFSDFCHLSIHGARRFSAALGQRLAEHPLVRRALSAASVDKSRDTSR